MRYSKKSLKKWVNNMLTYYEVNKKYYEKFGKNIGVPIDGYTEEYLQEHIKCIEENREFDSEKFFGKIPDDCII